MEESSGTSTKCGNDNFSERVRAALKELGFPEDYGTARNLPMHRDATELVPAGTDPHDRTIYLTPRTFTAWNEMKDAAAKDGFDLILEYGFRSFDYQLSLIRADLAAGADPKDLFTFYAVPGFSEHHSGRAIDIAIEEYYPMTSEAHFERTEEYQWLLKNANKFGFFLSYPEGNRHGIRFEPWHWFFTAV